MTENELIITAIYAAAFLVLFALGEILYHMLKMPVEITRKFVHVITGFICLSFPFYITTHWSVLILNVSFVAVLVLSMKLNLLKSINAVKRKTGGSFMFPMVIYITWWGYSIFGLNDMDASGLVWDSEVSFSGVASNSAGVFYFLPLLILSICDPVAALTGKRWPLGKYKIFGGSKTIMGSSAFFLTALPMSLFFTVEFTGSIIAGLVVASIIALTTTIVEALSQRGLDNLLIPISTIVVLILSKNM